MGFFFFWGGGGDAKILNIFLGMPDITDNFFGCKVDAGSQST